jgi:hypothetical protein
VAVAGVVVGELVVGEVADGGVTLGGAIDGELAVCRCRRWRSESRVAVGGVVVGGAVGMCCTRERRQAVGAGAVSLLF